jgi:hypothetical protein
MMLYYSVHYPKPEKEALLIDAMRHVGKIIKSLPGCLFDNAFQDGSLGTDSYEWLHILKVPVAIKIWLACNLSV